MRTFSRVRVGLVIFSVLAAAVVLYAVMPDSGPSPPPALPRVVHVDPACASVKSEEALDFDLPAQTGSMALGAFKEVAGVCFVYMNAFEGLTFSPVQGRLTRRAALERLLARTSCWWEELTDGHLFIRCPAQAREYLSRKRRAGSP